MLPNEYNLKVGETPNYFFNNLRIDQNSLSKKIDGK